MADHLFSCRNGHAPCDCPKEPLGVRLCGRFITVEEWAESRGVSLATARRHAVRRSKMGDENGEPMAIKVGDPGRWIIKIGELHRE